MSYYHPLIQQRVLLTHEFAKRIGISRATVYNWISEGRIIGHLIARTYFIPESELKRIATAAGVSLPLDDDTQ